MDDEKTARDMADEAPDTWIVGIIFGMEYPLAAVRILGSMTREDTERLSTKAKALHDHMIETHSIINGETK